MKSERFQIASNFSNDYFDYARQTDNEDRLGPARAVASGWIPPESMLAGPFVAIGLACLLCFFFVGESVWAAILPLVYLMFHTRSWRKMCAIWKGRALNVLIGETSRNLLVPGLLLAVGVVVDG